MQCGGDKPDSMASWTLFVSNVGGKSFKIECTKSKEEMKVVDLKYLIEEKKGLKISEQRLLSGGKELKDSIPLSEYCTIRTDATIFLVMRLPGGAAQQQAAMNTVYGKSKGFEMRDEERAIPAGVRQSDEPCMICQMDDTPSMVMPCHAKHTMHPHCLINYAWSQVSFQAKAEIACSMCAAEWDLSVLSKYRKASHEELCLLEIGLSKNALDKDPKIAECPGCNGFCERQDETRNRISCILCRKEGKKDFCWFCKKPWNGSGNDCGYAECKASGVLAQIKDAPLKNISGKMCPSIRLCPRCGGAIHHESGCKRMICKSDACSGKNVEFCFICLCLTIEGSRCSYDCALAPVQTTVPKL